MPFELKVAEYCGLIAELRAMKPGESRDFQPDKTLSPIRVHCMGGKYRPEEVQFQIVEQGIPVNRWLDLERVVCGIFFLQGVKGKR